MSIIVQFEGPPTGPLQVAPDRKGRVTLPNVRVTAKVGLLTPVALRNVAVRVTGDLVGAATLAAGYGGHSLPFREFNPLAGEGDLSLADLVLSPFPVEVVGDELPPGEYTLTVEAEFQTKPQFPHGPWGPVTTTGHERKLEVGHGAGVRLTAEWVHRELAVGGKKPAELHVYAERMPDAGRLAVTVHDLAERVPPRLRDSIDAALRVDTRAVENGSAERKKYVVTTDVVWLDDAVRSEALALAPLHLDLLVSVWQEERASGGQPAIGSDRLGRCLLQGEKGLVVDFADNVFDGFPIVDLGTSSVFAVIMWRFGSEGFLPAEQEQSYRTQLLALLARTDGVCGTKEWLAVLARTASECGEAEADPAQGLLKFLWRTTRSEEGALHKELYQVLRGLEVSAGMVLAADDVRLGIRRLLADLHAQAFALFPLKKQKLIPVVLDPDVAATGSRVPLPIPSTTQVTQVGVTPAELQLEIGRAADDSRRQAMRESDPSTLPTRFHSSPKRYYDLLGRAGQAVEVSAGEAVEQCSPRTFLVAALTRIREQIDQFRQRHDRLRMREGTKRFNKVVLTFPTSAGLNVRVGLMEAAKEAGFADPDCSLDEALSAIVFHLVKPFGDDKEFGLEAFRAGCRPVPRAGDGLPLAWVHNVLLIDIGAGTTDIALVEAQLTDQTSKEVDTSLGRYYRLTPTLRGVTGKAQLAGNLLTLYLFHEIKKRVADAVLVGLPQLTSDDEADKPFLDRVRSVATDLRPPFAADGKYAANSLVTHHDAQKLWKPEGHNAEACWLTGRVVSTAWRDEAGERPAAARQFQELWELAEQLKVTMFAADPPVPYVMPTDRLAELLGVTPALAKQVSTVTLDPPEVLAALDRPLAEIAELAVNLVKSRLELDPTTDPTVATRRTLDRIVLTGRMCRLPRVREAITAAFRRAGGGGSSELDWNPAHITYEDDYAKQAAAIGASYARVLREARNAPDACARHDGNQLDVDINNLMTYLPCSFKLENPGGIKNINLLDIGTRFCRFNSQQVGYMHSDWRIHPSETLSILKYDYEDSQAVTWGVLDCKRLCEEAQMVWPTFQQEVRAALETDHRQVIHLLFCRGGVPHYELPTRKAEWNLVSKLVDCNLVSPDATDWLAAMSGWELWVNVESQYPERLFTLRPDLFASIFRDTSLTEVRAAEGDAVLPSLPASKEDRYAVRPADGSHGWTVIGAVPRPTAGDGNSLPVRVILTAAGDLHLQTGDLTFKPADRPTDLQQLGLVFRRPPAYPPPSADDMTDPFCGRH